MYKIKTNSKITLKVTKIINKRKKYFYKTWSFKESLSFKDGDICFIKILSLMLSSKSFVAVFIILKLSAFIE